MYRHVFGYRIGHNVRIGLSFIDCARVEIGDSVVIGHLNRFQDIPLVQVGERSSIGQGNWFVAAPEFIDPRGIAQRGNRPALIVGRHVGIANWNHFDVNDTVTIGDFTTIAGKGSQFFTHYLDVRRGTNGVKPLSIGRYCMIGSSARFVPGSSVPDYCVVGMGAVVTKASGQPYTIIGGNPARVVGSLPPDAAYFTRTRGYIGTYAPEPHGDCPSS